VLDAAGARHVVFQDAGVFHATDASGAWVIELVAGGGTPSIDVDAGGALHVALIDAVDGVLHARLAAGVWVTEVVDASGADQTTDIAVGPDGIIHLAHMTDAGRLRHAASQPGVLDGMDDDCDGVDGVDADADGHASRATGGGDCNDRDAAIHPGAADPIDLIDQACDG
jgi:hypothetical protein